MIGPAIVAVLFALLLNSASPVANAPHTATTKNAVHKTVKAKKTKKAKTTRQMASKSAGNTVQAPVSTPWATDVRPEKTAAPTPSVAPAPDSLGDGVPSIAPPHVTGPVEELPPLVVKTAAVLATTGPACADTWWEKFKAWLRGKGC